MVEPLLLNILKVFFDELGQHCLTELSAVMEMF